MRKFVCRVKTLSGKDVTGYVIGRKERWRAQSPNIEDFTGCDYRTKTSRHIKSISVQGLKQIEWFGQLRERLMTGEEFAGRKI